MDTDILTVPVTASDAALHTIVVLQSMSEYGPSLLAASKTAMFAPAGSRARFQLNSAEFGELIVIFSGIGVWAPGAPFSELFDSTLRSHVQLDESASLCFHDTVFYTQNCTGFSGAAATGSTYHCCRRSSDGVQCSSQNMPGAMSTWRAGDAAWNQKSIQCQEVALSADFLHGAAPPATVPASTEAINATASSRRSSSGAWYASIAAACISAMLLATLASVTALLVARKHGTTSADAATVCSTAANVKDSHVWQQLSQLAFERFCVCGRLMLHSPKAMRCVGSSIVVPVIVVDIDKKQSKVAGGPHTWQLASADGAEELVATFHTDQAIFDRERAILLSSEWKQFAGALVSALPAAGTALLYAKNMRIPPVIVATRGVTLEEWAITHNQGIVQTLHTLVQVCRCAPVRVTVAMMHVFL